MSVIKKYKVILQQDECAPDASEQFNREFQERFGITRQFITEGKVPVDLGDTFVYLWGDFKIINEIGLWSVQE